MGSGGIHGRKKAERSLATDVGSLDCGPVLQNGQQREDSSLRKIGVLEKPARIADYVTKLELNGLKIGFYPLAARMLHRTEQPVSLRIVPCGYRDHLRFSLAWPAIQRKKPDAGAWGLVRRAFLNCLGALSPRHKGNSKLRFMFPTSGC